MQWQVLVRRNVAERDTLERRLRLQLDSAAEQYKEAKQTLRVALNLRAELGCGHADGDHAFRRALQQETAARGHYTAHLKAFTDFILHGKIPEAEE